MFPPLDDATPPFGDDSVANGRAGTNTRAVFTLVWLGGPALVGLLVSVATPKRRSWPFAMAVGLLLGIAFVLWSYFASPHGYDGDSDGEMFLGRWWEPTFTMFLVVVGYVGYAIGAAIGIGVRALIRR
jgi:hypothetical protein